MRGVGDEEVLLAVEVDHGVDLLEEIARDVVDGDEDVDGQSN